MRLFRSGWIRAFVIVIVGGSGVVAAGCGTVGSSTSPSPSPSGPAPGQWQLVIEVDDMPGAGRIPPQTMSMCSTAEDKRQWQDMVGGKASAGCNVRSFSANGPTVSYAMQCGSGIEGETTITVIDDDNYRGESTLTLRSGAQATVIKSRMTGKRLSKACAK